MATAPVYGAVPVVARARLAAANTARDGSGVITTLVTPGTGGSRIERIIFTSAQLAAAANSAMVGRVFTSDAAGANFRLRAEVVIPAATASNTVIGAQSIITFPGGLPLKAGVLVGVTISVYAGVQDQMDVIAEGSDF